MRTVLVTGAAGFIGSRFVRLLLEKYPSDKVVALDALTYAGNLENLAEAQGRKNYVFLHADIRDAAGIDAVFSSHEIDAMVNFAAETHVDRSIADAAPFLATNVLGTGVLLEAARKHWLREGWYRPGARFLQISTDEVYGPNEDAGVLESAPLLPRNPYAASKAGADMLVRAYFETYALPVLTARSSNNFGPCQLPEKLIPLAVKRCYEGQGVPVYGDGTQVRSWLHVDDNCEALDTILQRGEPGEIYNVGGGAERTNLEVVKSILKSLGKDERSIAFVRDRPGHDRRYAMNGEKLARLGWQPKCGFEEGLSETINWYLAHPERMR